MSAQLVSPSVGVEVVPRVDALSLSVNASPDASTSVIVRNPPLGRFMVHGDAGAETEDPVPARRGPLAPVACWLPASGEFTALPNVAPYHWLVTSVERWKRYEPWLGELRDLLPDRAVEAESG